MSKTIVNLAPTGMIPTRAMSRMVPLTPSEIVEDVRRCAPLGVSMVHLHARDADESPTRRKVHARARNSNSSASMSGLQRTTERSKERAPFSSRSRGILRLPRRFQLQFFGDPVGDSTTSATGECSAQRPRPSRPGEKGPKAAAPAWWCVTRGRPRQRAHARRQEVDELGYSPCSKMRRKALRGQQPTGRSNRRSTQPVDDSDWR